MCAEQREEKQPIKFSEVHLMLLRFLHQKKNHNLEVIGCFLSCFWPPLQNTVWIAVVDCRLRSKHPLLWLAYTHTVSLTVYTDGRCWFRLKTNNIYLFNRQSNSDHVIKQLFTLVCCDINVVSNIFGTASSFSFNLSENPTSNCALFVNESAVKWSEQRTELLMTQSGTSLKIMFIHSFLMQGSEGRQCKHCFFSQLGTAQSLVVFGASLSFGFCVDLRSPLFLIIYITCINQWAGLNRLWCRSRCWSSSAEAVFTHTITL